MNKKKRILLIVFISLLIMLLMVFLLFFFFLKRKEEEYEDLAHQFCVAFETKDIYGFDEILEDDTIFRAQNSIYKYIREEFKDNLENKDFTVIGYDISKYDREMGWLLLTIYFKADSSEDIHKLSGYLVFASKNHKSYISRVALTDEESLGYTYEIIAKHNEHIDLSHFLH